MYMLFAIHSVCDGYALFAHIPHTQFLVRSRDGAMPRNVRVQNGDAARILHFANLPMEMREICGTECVCVRVYIHLVLT